MSNASKLCSDLVLYIFPLMLVDCHFLLRAKKYLLVDNVNVLMRDRSMCVQCCFGLLFLWSSTAVPGLSVSLRARLAEDMRQTPLILCNHVWGSKEMKTLRVGASDPESSKSDRERLWSLVVMRSPDIVTQFWCGCYYCQHTSKKQTSTQRNPIAEALIPIGQIKLETRSQGSCDILEMCNVC